MVVFAGSPPSSHLGPGLDSAHGPAASKGGIRFDRARAAEGDPVCAAVTTPDNRWVGGAAPSA